MSLRERTRRAVRAELIDAAMRLFLSQGFEVTTVEEIAQAAGISRRSYFRYFASKDEVFAGALASIGQAIGHTLAKRPLSESPWDALRRAFDPLLDQAGTDPNAEALGRLMLERPSLQQGKHTAWQTEIATALETRLPADATGDRSLSAQALAAAAIACLHTAQAQWLAPDEHRELATLLDMSMDAVHPSPSRRGTLGTREPGTVGDGSVR
ncbi:TetR family transcriptional regulator [Tamaricihabitans halophyticus]|uniref:TetR family transcriptional regulator n=1 Tax=Tamaricihabitans halophyticus TaxID=1262583 RepID=A0A4R2Q3J7_9PSEU|nr:TetR/AcrR family transcriptional regulator [Tamaricihabitans halophyticus]TCP41211.1 TetR family transcriptional regulator [Tamaricihabitans halophyticus]